MADGAPMGTGPGDEVRRRRSGHGPVRLGSLRPALTRTAWAPLGSAWVILGFLDCKSPLEVSFDFLIG